MAMNDPTDPLARATRALQNTDEPDWDAVQRSRVLHRIQSAVTSAELVLMRTPHGGTSRDADGSITAVSTRVLRRALREGLLPDGSSMLDNLRFTVKDKHLQSVDLYLIGAYGQDLHEAAESRRHQANSILTDLLGHSDFDIDITITDLPTEQPE